MALIPEDWPGRLSLMMKVYSVVLVLGMPVLMFGVRYGWRWKMNCKADTVDSLFSVNDLDDEMMWMIFAVSEVASVLLWVGSYDLKASEHLLNFVIWSTILHAIVMIPQAMLDWDEEWHHLMPWGDVPNMLLSGFLLLYVKRKAHAAFEPDSEAASTPDIESGSPKLPTLLTEHGQQRQSHATRQGKLTPETSTSPDTE